MLTAFLNSGLCAMIRMYVPVTVFIKLMWDFTEVYHPLHPTIHWAVAITITFVLQHIIDYAAFAFADEAVKATGREAALFPKKGT